MVVASGAAAAVAAGVSAATTPASCAVGAALAAAGESAAAKAAYVQVLTARPRAACPRQGLARLARGTAADRRAAVKRACAGAARLAAAGATAEARAAYVEIVKSHDALCARSALKKTIRDKPWLERAEERLSDVTKLLSLAAVAGLIGLAGLSALFVAGTYLGWLRARLRSAWLIRSLFQPRLALAAFENGAFTPPAASEAQALVRQHLHELAAMQGGRSRYILDRVSGTEGVADAVGKLGDLAPQFKALSALLSVVPQLARLPRYTLNATLHAAAKRGGGMTAVLDEQHASSEAATLWSGSANADTGTYHGLAAGTAAWADFSIRKRERMDLPWITNNAVSFAYLRSAIQVERAGNDARPAYLSALRADAGNVGALLNLAVLDGRRHNFEEAVALLAFAKRIIEERAA